MHHKGAETLIKVFLRYIKFLGTLIFGGAYTWRCLMQEFIIDDSFKQTFSVADLSHSYSTRL